MKDYPFLKLYIANFQRDIIGKSFEQIGEYIVNAVSAWMDGDTESMPSWMSDEYEKLAEKSQKLAENGRKGGQAKAKQILAIAKQIPEFAKQRREEKSREDKNREEINTIPPLPPKGFDEFWESYPKKVGKAKAKDLWIKLKPDIEVTLSALLWQKESDQWTRDGGQFIPNPATYLSQGRWDDEKPQSTSMVSTMQAQFNRLYGSNTEAITHER